MSRASKTDFLEKRLTNIVNQGWVFVADLNAASEVLEYLQDHDHATPITLKLRANGSVFIDLRSL
jgi:hypothetical protein